MEVTNHLLNGMILQALHGGAKWCSFQRIWQITLPKFNHGTQQNDGFQVRNPLFQVAIFRVNHGKLWEGKGAIW